MPFVLLILGVVIFVSVASIFFRASPQLLGSLKSEVNPETSEANSKAFEFWDSLITKCGDSAFIEYKPPRLSDFIKYKPSRLIYEFKNIIEVTDDPRFSGFSEADKLNRGWESATKSSLMSGAYQSINPEDNYKKWSGWRDTGLVNIANIPNSLLSVTMYKKVGGQWEVAEKLYDEAFIFTTPGTERLQKKENWGKVSGGCDAISALGQ